MWLDYVGKRIPPFANSDFWSPRFPFLVYWIQPLVLLVLCPICYGFFGVIGLVSAICIYLVLIFIPELRFGDLRLLCFIFNENRNGSKVFNIIYRAGFHDEGIYLVASETVYPRYYWGELTSVSVIYSQDEQFIEISCDANDPMASLASQRIYHLPKRYLDRKFYDLVKKYAPQGSPLRVWVEENEVRR